LFSVTRLSFTNYLGITESTPSCRTCARQSEGECFLCCKQNAGLRTIFFSEATVTGHVHLDVLEHFLVPQSVANNVIWQQDGAPPHYHMDVTRYLNKTFPGRWIGRGGYIPWPLRSPDLTPMDFSFWRFVKDNVYIPAMPVYHQERNDRIVNATALVDVTFLNKL
jgi:hypothetical protein